MKDFLFFYNEEVYLWGDLFRIRDGNCGECFFCDINCTKLIFACADYNGDNGYIFENIKYDVFL